MKSAVFVCAVAALLALAAALPVKERTIEAHACVSEASCKVHDYLRVSRADKTAMHTITMWSAQNGFAASCGSMLEEISDPDSPKFGQHVKFEDLKALVYDAKSLKAIHKFLDAHNVAESSRVTAPNGEWVEVTAPIATLETMFSAQFSVYVSESRKSKITRATKYTIPSAIAEAVTTVAGIANFPMYYRHSKIEAFTMKKSVEGPGQGGMYPALIVKTYRLPNETDATPKANMGVFEALGQSYSDADLAAFQKQYGLPRQKIAKVVGPNDPASCSSDPNNCVEATLDVEYIMAMAQGAPLTFWSIADEQGDIFLEWIKAVSKASTVPQVFSISYGGPEHLQNQPDMTQFSTEVCKAGLRGMTVFVASGDDGVAGYEARDDPSQCGFKPEYPANVPYVTTVGATMGPALVPARAEIVCQSNTGSIITSGGGFSAHFTQPSWQSSAVSTYLSTGPNIPPKNLFSPGGRAYPDVASLGNAYNVVVGGNWFQVSGTSAASPVFCGMVTLINGLREKAGKQPIGFLNPILYKIDKSTYNDIVSGINNCCAKSSASPTCCKYGFTASKGWDAATGWGSLDYPLFAQALNNLP